MVSRASGRVSRRAALIGGTAAALLALPGCASIQQAQTENVVRRLLEAASRRAIARLTAPDGFWDSSVARIALPVLFTRTGRVVQTVLTSDVFREQLQRRLNRIAEEGARRAAPVLADAVRAVGPANAKAILKGGPTAATSLLRAQTGPALVNAMIPALGEAMRLADDPLLGKALAALAGVNLSDAAHALAIEADNAIWYEIGAQEAAIRQDPEAGGDAVLAAALRAA